MKKLILNEIKLLIFDHFATRLITSLYIQYNFKTTKDMYALDNKVNMNRVYFGKLFVNS